MHNKLSPKTQRKSAWLFSLLLHTLIQNTAKNMWHAKHVLYNMHRQEQFSNPDNKQTNMHIDCTLKLRSYHCLSIFIMFLQKHAKWGFAVMTKLWSEDFEKNKHKKTVPTVRTDPVIPFTFDCLIAYVFIWWRCKEMTHIRCSFTVSFHLQPTNELWR